MMHSPMEWRIAICFQSNLENSYHIEKILYRKGNIHITMRIVIAQCGNLSHKMEEYLHSAIFFVTKLKFIFTMRNERVQNRIKYGIVDFSYKKPVLEKLTGR